MTGAEQRPQRLDVPRAIWWGDYDIYIPSAIGGSGSAYALDSDAAPPEKGLYLPDGTFKPLRKRPPLGFGNS